jgi:hypothetical protein
VLYLGTSPCEPAVADLLDRRRLGLMCQPESNPPRAGWIWAADNGCFADGWDEDRWRAWLLRGHPRSGCLFATVPDVVGDADATLERFRKYAAFVRRCRYPVALVAQDGLERRAVPWHELDCLFIGGTTEWKLSEHARTLAQRAREHGKWVHVGRVNSERRFLGWAAQADSCDGTFLAFGPRTNLPKLVRWLERFDHAPQLPLEAS